MTAGAWTEERVNKLKTLWMLGFSGTQIAKQLGGVSRCAVLGKVDRLGLPKRVSPHKGSDKQRGIRRKPRVLAMPSAPRTIRAAEPRFRSGAPSQGIAAIRFIDREPGQCSMFCEGEDGALGFVCGAPIAVKQWCSNCARLAYEKGREAA